MHDHWIWDPLESNSPLDYSPQDCHSRNMPSKLVIQIPEKTVHILHLKTKNKMLTTPFPSHNPIPSPFSS